MANRHDEAVLCLQDAILMGRAPSELRFLLAQMVKYGASREHLEEQFFENLRDDEEKTEDSVHSKITALLSNERYPDGGQNENQNIRVADPNSALSCLRGEQLYVATQLMNAVLQNTHQLMFLQGAAGTGKTFTVNTLIKELQSTYRKNCLICATTGIAAVQYPGGTTIHSLFRLGIDEEVQGSFRCNIGRNRIEARHLLRADLIIIDEVSMLTPWVANRVSVTLQSISVHSTRLFGGKTLFFVGDLFQIPPVVKNFSMPVVYRLITHSADWSLMKNFSWINQEGQRILSAPSVSSLPRKVILVIFKSGDRSLKNSE
jgi:GTPase SAR1 family protein